MSVVFIMTAAAHSKEGEIKWNGFLLWKEGGQGILLLWGEKGGMAEIVGLVWQIR